MPEARFDLALVVESVLGGAYVPIEPSGWGLTSRSVFSAMISSTSGWVRHGPRSLISCYVVDLSRTAVW